MRYTDEQCAFIKNYFNKSADEIQNTSSVAKVELKCSKSHVWISTIDGLLKAKREPCPYCDDRKVLEGYNNLAFLKPNLMIEIPVNQSGYDSIAIESIRSSRVITWVCSNGHSYERSISSRLRNNGCSYCSGKIFDPNINSLKAVYPEVAKSWNYEKNKAEFDLDGPEHISRATVKSVHWTCVKCCFDEFKSVQNRTKTGCGACEAINVTGSKVQQGVNDLKTIFPNIAKRWSQKNKLSPNEITAYANVLAYYDCEKCNITDLRRSAIIRNHPDSCNYCSGKKLRKGFNDFQTLYPELAKEWSSENDFTPDSFSRFYSVADIQWLCDKSHRWTASVISRIKGNRCPVCYNSMSKLQEEITKYLQKEYPAIDMLVNDRSVLDGKEIDLLIPKLSIGIEVNGNYWHSDEIMQHNYSMTAKERHTEKLESALSKGYNLVFIWESDWKNHNELIKVELRDLITKGVIGQNLSKLEINTNS